MSALQSIDYSAAKRSPTELTSRSAVGNGAITGELARLLLATHAEYLGAFTACRRRQSTSHVHHLRIATRRLRVMTALCESAGPSELGRGIRRILRRPFRAAGKLRDRQVARDMLKGDAHRNTNARSLRRWLAPRDDEDRQRLRVALRCKRAAKLTALVAELGGRLQYSASRPKSSRRVVAHTADAVESMRKEFAETSLAGVGRTELHDLRIRVKRLRYALELLEPVLEPTIHGKVGELRRLQRALGEVTDRGMLIDRIRTCVSTEPDRGRLFLELEARLRHEREARVGGIRAELIRMQGSGRNLRSGMA